MAFKLLTLPKGTGSIDVLVDERDIKYWLTIQKAIEKTGELSLASIVTSQQKVQYSHNAGGRRSAFVPRTNKDINVDHLAKPDSKN